VARSRRRQLLLFYGVALAGSAFVLTPVLWMISTALKSDNAVLSVPPQLLPHDPKWSNFGPATTLIPFWRYLRNSVFIAGVGAVGTVLSAALVAYPLARLRAAGMRIVFALVLATLLLPQQILLVSQFLIFKRLGWYGTYLPLIVPSWLGGGAFNVFLLRQFFLTLPREQDQAALIDGAGYFRIFWRIILPQSVPALLAVGLLDFTSKWNDFLGPLIYLNRTESYTLPLGLASFRDLYNTSWNYLMAGTILAALPCAVLFFVAQRLLVRGLVVRATKG
jgi:ABC-type glycerol-3-phosphate transport system permease component